jgi:hypothetical protein
MLTKFRAWPIKQPGFAFVVDPAGIEREQHVRKDLMLLKSSILFEPVAGLLGLVASSRFAQRRMTFLEFTKTQIGEVVTHPALECAPVGVDNAPVEPTIGIDTLKPFWKEILERGPVLKSAL